jgi:hypothetical protein
MTRPGIDPGTFRLVAQRLNYYANPVYQFISGSFEHFFISSVHVIFITLFLS